MLATNDPEIGTGHLPDVTMVTPIFRNGKVVAYAGSIAHLPDVGGRPLSPDATDIFEEGIRFPILKLHKGGEPNRDVLDIIAASVRLPTEVLGDLDSMAAANAVMGRELTKFLDEYGLNEVDELADAIHARSEAQMRKAIRAWPNGTYRAETILDGFDSEVTLAVAVTVSDETVHVDYAGSSDQVTHGINVRTNYLYAPASTRSNACSTRRRRKTRAASCRSPTRRPSAPSSTPTPRRPETPATSSGTSSRA